MERVPRRSSRKTRSRRPQPELLEFRQLLSHGGVPADATHSPAASVVYSPGSSQYGPWAGGWSGMGVSKDQGRWDSGAVAESSMFGLGDSHGQGLAIGRDGAHGQGHEGTSPSGSQGEPAGAASMYGPSNTWSAPQPSADVWAARDASSTVDSPTAAAASVPIAPGALATGMRFGSPSAYQLGTPLISRQSGIGDEPQAPPPSFVTMMAQAARDAEDAALGASGLHVEPPPGKGILPSPATTHADGEHFDEAVPSLVDVRGTYLALATTASLSFSGPGLGLPASLVAEHAPATLRTGMLIDPESPIMVGMFETRAAMLATSGLGNPKPGVVVTGAPLVTLSQEEFHPGDAFASTANVAMTASAAHPVDGRASGDDEPFLPISRSAEMLARFSPFDAETVERAFDDLLSGLDDLDSEFSQLGEPTSIVPGIVAAVVSFSIAEVVRRRVRGRWDDESSPFEADEDARVPGLPGRWDSEEA